MATYSEDQTTRRILHGQTAPRAGYGVRILWRCPTCGLPWLQDPRLPHGCRVRLSEQEAARHAPDLQARLDDLPQATCRLCTYALGGELAVDQYGQGEGYGLSWEGVAPQGAHLLGAVFSVRWAERQPEAPQPGIVTDPGRLHAFLHWLAVLPVPPRQALLSAEQGALLALSTPPGHGAPGTADWLWRGAFQVLPCPPLGDSAVVSLAEAMPPEAPWSLDLFTAQWRALARRALRYRLEQGTHTGQEA